MAKINVQERMMRRSYATCKTVNELSEGLLKLMPANLNVVERAKVVANVKLLLTALRVIYKDDKFATEIIEHISNLSIGLQRASLNPVERENTNAELSVLLKALAKYVEREFNDKSDSYMKEVMYDSNCVLEKGVEDASRRMNVSFDNKKLVEKLSKYDINPNM